MRKLFIVGAAILVAVSFGTAQGSDELRGGVTDPGVADSPNDNSTNQTNATSSGGSSSGSACGSSPGAQGSSTAQSVLNTIFCTVGNIGNALSSLLGG